MGNIGAGELVLIAGVALLLFGAGRIADVGRGLGQGIKNFKMGLREANEELPPVAPKAESDTSKAARPS